MSINLTSPPKFSDGGLVANTNAAAIAALAKFADNTLVNSVNKSRKLISTTTISSPTANVDFTDLVAGKDYEIEMDGVICSVQTTIAARLSNNNGVSYRSASSDYIYSYHYQYNSSVGGQAYGGVTGMLLGDACGTTSAFPLSSKMFMRDPNNSTYKTELRSFWRGSVSGATHSGIAVGHNVTAEANNAIRFYPTSGNFTGGIFKLWELS